MNNKYLKTLISVETTLIKMELDKDDESLYEELKCVLDKFYSEINSEIGVSEYSSLILMCYKYSKKIDSKKLLLLINECNQKLEEYKKNNPSDVSKDYYNGVVDRKKTMYNPKKTDDLDKVNIECEKWLANIKSRVDDLQIDDINEYGNLLMNINSFEKFYNNNGLSKEDISYFKGQISELRHAIYKRINQKNSTIKK